MHANTSLARLPQLFKNEGVGGSGLAFDGKILLQTDAIENRFIFPEGALVGSMKKMAGTLAFAQQQCKPDFLLTNDEVLIKNLLRLRRNLQSGGDHLNEAQRELLLLLEKSLLPKDEIYGRSTSLQIAEKSGFNIPEGTVAYSSAQVKEEATRFGFPFYLKRNFEGGGFGVHHITSEENLRTTISSHFSSNIIDDNNPILLQKPCHGTEFTINFAAWNGKLLGYEVIQSLEKVRENGPSSVVQTVYRPNWEGMIQELVKHTYYTGFGGLDIFEGSYSDIPEVIEINFRPTQSLQMALQLNSTLISAFSECLLGKPANDVKACLHKDENRIATIFPDELVRDKNSFYALNTPSNIPWNDPKLLSEFLRKLKIKLM